MSSGRPALAAAMLLIGPALLVGCSSGPKAPAADPTRTPSTSASPAAKHQARSPIPAEEALLNARAQGIRTHDLALFLRGDDPRQPQFIERDRAYFAAVSSLPWEVFQYQVTATPWPQQLIDPAWGSKARLPQVVFSSQLAGFDPNVVARTTGFAFVTRGGRTYIASDETIHDHQFPGYQPDPWDVEPVTVVRTADALGIFDQDAAPDAKTVMTDLAHAIAGVGKDLPYPWSRKVVLYATASSSFATALVASAGGDLTHLGAMTYPLNPQLPGGNTRVLLLGSALNSGQHELAHTIRHEVTHVALGDEATGVPLWLVEGIAEYEGAKAVPPAQRQIPDIAIQRAQHPPKGMPASATFHDADQDWHYAISWMACQYIVQTGGQPLLWALLDAMHNGGAGTTDAQQDAILEQVLGMNSAQLAVHASALIRSTYG